MNKSDLIEKVSRDCKLSKATAEQALNSVFSAITNAVAGENKVTLIGFGS